MAEGAGKTDVGTLVADHHAELYRYAYRLTGSTADAEDLTQQVFLQVQRKLHQLRDVESARGWLFAILRNCYRASLRKPIPLTAGGDSFQLEEIPEPVGSAADVDGERLQLALDELPDDFRLVLVMFYFEDCSYREIAERLHLPPGTVMSRLARAKSRLRKKLVAATPGEVAQPARARRNQKLVSDRG